MAMIRKKKLNKTRFALIVVALKDQKRLLLFKILLCTYSKRLSSIQIGII